MTPLEQDESRYEAVPDWESRPDGMTYRDAAGVAVDSAGRVHVLTRGPSGIIVYDSDGDFLHSWGKGLFTDRTHGITIGPDDEIYVVDDADHTVRCFTSTYEPVLTLGTSGKPSDTGYDGRSHGSVRRAGGPFNRPTNVSVGPDGLLYVADGYGNSRVHVFSLEGQLLRSWGEPGSGAGQFRLVHGIASLPDGRVLVADRENDRIQIFNGEGTFVTEWIDVQRPTQLAYDSARDLIYVSELGWRTSQRSFVHGERGDLPSRVSVLNADGVLLGRWSAPDPCAPGGFVAAHGIAVDSTGSVYVAEVTWTIGVSQGLVPENCHTIQKFRPAD